MPISVIIPTINESQYITKLIKRLSDDVHVMEILIVDSPISEDRIESVLDDPKCIYMRCQTTGRNHQLNHGATTAKGDILYFVHADTIPPKNFGEIIIQAVDSGNMAGYFSYRFDKSNFWLNLNSKGTRYNTIFSGGGDQSLFIEKNLFHSVGMYSDKAVIMEDFYLVKTLRSKGYPPVLIKEDMIVSSRKYDENAYLKVNLINLLTMMQFFWGRVTCETQKVLSSMVELKNKSTSPYNSTAIFYPFSLAIGRYGRGDKS